MSLYFDLKYKRKKKDWWKKMKKKIAFLTHTKLMIYSRDIVKFIESYQDIISKSKNNCYQVMDSQKTIFLQVANDILVIEIIHHRENAKIKTIKF